MNTEQHWNVKNRTKESDLKVYPNPFIESTTIDFTNTIKSSSDNFRFYLYNILGEGNLSSSVYVYEVFQNEGVIDLGKLVVK
ncbi:hypothetical protein [Wocania ichthyoenteri]|uniref:hypothetical protein n=1 Tax=Wocania ichthyoenteri TaxID=1230531 RepID=UPI00053ED584|nr:hypothetical protein [Wocania ichthyoenteri]